MSCTANPLSQRSLGRLCVKHKRLVHAMEQMETPLRLKKEEVASPGSGGSDEAGAHENADEGKDSTPHAPSAAAAPTAGSDHHHDPENMGNPPGLEGPPMGDDVSLTFPQRLMEILDTEANSSIIAWVPHGRSFMIYRRQEFENQILPHYFQKQSKYSSFTRKLNRWGFTRVTRGPETGAYFHPLFRRGEHRLVMQMSCNSNVKNPGSSAQIMRAHHRHQQQHYSMSQHLPHGVAYYPPPPPPQQYPYPYAAPPPPPPQSPEEQQAAAQNYHQQMAYHQYYQQQQAAAAQHHHQPPPMPPAAPAPAPQPPAPAPAPAPPPAPAAAPAPPPAPMASPYYPPPPPPSYAYPPPQYPPHQYAPPPQYPPPQYGQYPPQYAAPPPYMMSPLPQGHPPPYAPPPPAAQPPAPVPAPAAPAPASTEEQAPSTPQKDPAAGEASSASKVQTENV